jgi:outer membrane receptor protein involved in Fe transport
MGTGRDYKRLFSLVAALKGGVSLAILSAAATPAVAQDDGAAAGRDTIVVTATKREQTLQETPVAVTVVSSDTLLKAEIQDILDLQSVVPSLSVGQGTSTIATAFSIRGFGSASNNAGIEPSVGVFVDGVYRSRPSAILADLLNVGRVEVLRGPQSTLFGKNASVGVISFITQAPEFEFGGSASLTYGNFDTVRVVGNITGPLSDSLAFRLAANYNRSDGYAKNLQTDSNVNNRNRWGVQGQLLYQPSDDFSVRIIGDYDEIDEICCYQSNIRAGAATLLLVDALGDIVIEDPFSYEYYANFDPTNELQNGGVSAHINKDLGFADITSITAYRKGENSTLFDIDQSSADILNSFNDGESETFTQELRLTSNDQDAVVDWLLGAYYFNESIDFPGGLEFGADARAFFDGSSGGAFTTAEALVGAPADSFRADGTGVTEFRGQDNTSFSIFGSADWHVTDRLTATVGLSYIYDEKDAFVSQVNTDAASQIDLVALGFGVALAGFGVDATDPAAVAAFAAANPAAFAAIQAGAQDPASNPFLGFAPFQALPQTLAIPNAVEDGRSEDDKLTYNFRLAYDITDNINVYGSYATGYKATSWNLSRDSRPTPDDFIPGSPVTDPPASPIRDAGLAIPNLRTGTRFAGPEESEVFEIGLKMAFENLSVNIALFDQNVQDFQTNVLVGQSGRVLANADEQSTKGAEIETVWSPLDGLTLSFAGTFLDAEYDSFPDSAFGDLTGERPAGISKISTSTGAEYSFNIGALDAFLRADWQYSSPAAYTDNAALQDFIGFEREFHLVNASAGFTTESGFGVSVWGRNILDEEYHTSVFTPLLESTSLSGFQNQPATYGVTVRKAF